MSFKRALPFLLLIQLAAVLYTSDLLAAWPTGSVPTTNLDSASDSPAAARADLHTMAGKVNSMMTEYQTGTWTPVLWDSSETDDGQTASVVGYYVAIGDFVWITFQITVTALGTLTITDGAEIGGLPFNVSSTIESGASCYEGTSLAITAGQNIDARFETNTNWMWLNLWDSANQTTRLLISELSINGNIRCSGWYRK